MYNQICQNIRDDRSKHGPSFLITLQQVIDRRIAAKQAAQQRLRPQNGRPARRKRVTPYSDLEPLPPPNEPQQPFQQHPAGLPLVREMQMQPPPGMPVTPQHHGVAPMQYGGPLGQLSRMPQPNPSGAQYQDGQEMSRATI